MRHWIAPPLVSLFLISGCGGSSDEQTAIPVEASEMDSDLKSNMATFVPLVVNAETSLIFLLNPGTPMTQGVTVTPDASPGAPPYTVTFSGPYDRDGDGLDETTMSGHATFDSDPDIAWSGVSGEVAVDVSIPLIGHLYHSDISFTILSDQRQISGSGTYTEPITGDTTTMTIPAASPLVIKAADETANAVSNACGYSLNGQIRLDVTGSDGTLTSYWNFNSSSPNVAVNGTSFKDTSGSTTALPDSSVKMICDSGSIDDWAGGFDQFYACLPRESGQARLTIAVAGPGTITINDEDPPNSGDSKTYLASILGDNTHAARGFFIGGPVGNRYREDFNWTLTQNNDSFSQISLYQYTEGPNTGSGGICVALAKRLP